VAGGLKKTSIIPGGFDDGIALGDDSGRFLRKRRPPRVSHARHVLAQKSAVPGPTSGPPVISSLYRQPNVPLILQQISSTCSAPVFDQAFDVVVSACSGCQYVNRHRLRYETSPRASGTQIHVMRAQSLVGVRNRVLSHLAGDHGWSIAAGHGDDHVASFGGPACVMTVGCDPADGPCGCPRRPPQLRARRAVRIDAVMSLAFTGQFGGQAATDLPARE